MDDQKTYDCIIERARHRTLDGYVERHHVVPKALGGKDGEIVRLTAREHLVVHLLLAKIYGGKMIRAAYFMVGQGKTSRLYERYREHHKQEFNKIRNIRSSKKDEHIRNLHKAPKTARQIEQIRQLGKINMRSEENRRKVSNALKGRVFSEETKKKIGIASRTSRIGYKHSEETKKKISMANTGKHNTLGRTHSEETKKRMSESRAKYWRRKNFNKEIQIFMCAY